MEVTILGQSYILACPEGGERALSGGDEQADAVHGDAPFSCS